MMLLTSLSKPVLELWMKHKQRKDRLLLLGTYFIIRAAAVLITNPVL